MSEVVLSELLPAGDDWIASLPNYQRDTLSALQNADDPLAAAALWLEASGPSDTAPFGAGPKGSTIFLVECMRELQKLLCTTEGYTEERRHVQSSLGAGKLIIVSAVSAAIAPYVGAAAALLVPAVAVILSVITNAGKNAACQSLAEAIARRETDMGG